MRKNQSPRNVENCRKFNCRRKKNQKRLLMNETTDELKNFKKNGRLGITTRLGLPILNSLTEHAVAQALRPLLLLRFHLNDLIA